VPVELRPLPITMGKAGQGSGKPLKGGVAHEVRSIFYKMDEGPCSF